MFGKEYKLLKDLRNAKVEEEYIEADGKEYTLQIVVYRGREYVDMNDLLAKICRDLEKTIVE